MKKLFILSRNFTLEGEAHGTCGHKATVRGRVQEEAVKSKLGQFGGGGGEVELFGGEASPAPPSLDETLSLSRANHIPSRI